MKTFSTKVYLRYPALIVLLILSSCGTSRFSIPRDSLPDTDNGIVITRLLFTDKDGSIVDPHAWWRYALYPFYGPVSVSVYLDKSLTDIEMDDQGFIVFQHPPGALPRNPRYHLQVYRPFLLGDLHSDIFFTKTAEPSVVQSGRITILPAYIVNLSTGRIEIDASQEAMMNASRHLKEKHANIYLTFGKEN